MNHYRQTSRSTNSSTIVLVPSGGVGMKNVLCFGFALLFFCVTLVISGCGGGSSGSSGTTTSTTTTGSRDVSALSLPDRVSLTEENGSSSSAAYRGSLVYNDAGTDYTNAEKHTWVEDGTDALTTVNEVLSVMDQTNYPDYVNYGPYKALVKMTEEQGQSQGGATSSSTETESYQEMILNVTRADDSSPMYVNIWLQEPEGPGDLPMLIRGRFIVTREAGGDYPFGELEAHFKGNQLSADGSVGTELMQMALSIGKDADGHVVVEYVEDMDEGEHFHELRKARVLANSDLSEGNAYIYKYRMENFGQGLNETEGTSYVAYNADYFKVQPVGSDTEVYDKNDLSHRIFRYGLFRKDTGAAVSLTSGFPIQLADGTNAYVGYYGLWAPYGVEINDGDTITRVDNSTEYTVVKKRGVLMKHTAATVTLSDLQGTEMSYWDNSTGQDKVISWDGSNFKIIGSRNNDNGQITYADGGNVTFQEWDGAWCESLRTWLPLGRLYKDDQGNATTPTGATVLKYHSEQRINPGDATDLTLYFGDFALDAPITSAVLAGANDAEQQFWQNRTISTFFFDASEMVLKETDENGDAVIWPADLSAPQGSRYDWGYHMMPLVTDSSLTADTWWQAYDEDTYYSWQTGDDEWQHFTTLKDADGNYVAFDPPMRMNYTHSNANDANWSTGDPDVRNNGKKFNMEYNGFDLFIPWEYDDTAGDWIPGFNIADGVTVSANGVDYVIKGIDEALIMESLNSPPAAADALTIVEVDPPTLTYDSTITDQVGDPSTVSDAEIPAGVSGPQLLVVGGTTIR